MKDSPQGLPGPVRIIFGLLVFVLGGTLLMMLPPVSSGAPLDFRTALFTAVSALTVTGLSIITPTVELSVFGKVVLMLLIQIGGVGYMVFAVLLFRMLGRSVLIADKLALRDALGVMNLRGIVDLTRQILIFVIFVEFLGAILLFLHWRSFMPDDRAAFYALFHSISAFCNAGFDLFTGHPEYPQGIPADAWTLGIFGGLIVLGGLGIPVLYDILRYPWARKVSLHSRLTMLGSGALILWGGFAIMICEAWTSGKLQGLAFSEQIKFAVFQSISCRTAGYAMIPSFGEISEPTQLLMVTLMFIGCGPASMGGGVTTGTFLVLVLALLAYSRGQTAAIFGGKAIPGEMVRKASAVLTISIFAVLTSAWLLMLTNGLPFNKAIFEVVSAFATCGLTLDVTTKLNPVGQGIIIVMMCWGRLGALTILVALSQGKKVRRVTFPEEKVLIG